MVLVVPRGRLACRSDDTCKCFAPTLKKKFNKRKINKKGEFKEELDCMFSDGYRDLDKIGVRLNR